MLPQFLINLMATLKENEEAKKFIVTPPANPGSAYAFSEPYYLFTPGVITQDKPSQELVVLIGALSSGLAAYVLSCDISPLQQQIQSPKDVRHVMVGALGVVCSPLSITRASSPWHYQMLGFYPLGVNLGPAIFAFSSFDQLTAAKMGMPPASGWNAGSPSVFGSQFSSPTRYPAPAWGGTPSRMPAIGGYSDWGQPSTFSGQHTFQRGFPPVPTANLRSEAAAEQSWYSLCEEQGWSTDQSTQLVVFERFLRHHTLFGRFMEFALRLAAEESIDAHNARTPKVHEENPLPLTDEEAAEQDSAQSDWDELCEREGWKADPVTQIKILEWFLVTSGLCASWVKYINSQSMSGDRHAHIGHLETFIHDHRLFGSLVNYAKEYAASKKNGRSFGWNRI